MSFLDYCKDHVRGAAAWLLGLAILTIGLWLDPAHRLSLNTLLYLDFLLLLIGAGFFWWQYLRRNQFLKQLTARREAGKDALDWRLPVPHNHEQALIATTFNHLLADHQQIMNDLISRQQDQQAFIDSWVHEIKVPLAATTLLTDSLTDQAPEATLDQMNLELDKINYYVEQVMYYARLDSFSKDYLLAEYPLKPLVNAVIVAQRNSFIAKHLRFTLNGADQVVVTDEKWLRFILTQLVTNAIKYTADGGVITITLADDGHETTITVADTGIGIPADELHRVFDKGFTGSNGRQADQASTGLGLYLASRLAEKLGHTLTISATLRVGTAVVIHCPHLTYFGQSGSTLTKPQLTAEEPPTRRQT